MPLKSYIIIGIAYAIVLVLFKLSFAYHCSNQGLTVDHQRLFTCVAPQ
jgi:hypothetical protein